LVRQRVCPGDAGVTKRHPRRTRRQDSRPGRRAHDSGRPTSTLLGARPVRPSGRSVFSDAIWRLLAESLELSGRESQIVQAIFDDQKESAIAVTLGISSHTVHTHLERLYRKLGITSRVLLVAHVFVEYLRLQGP
jgi:DNA-binding CsgD family transcriptional regulator